MSHAHAFNVLKAASDHFHYWIVRPDALSQKIALRYMARAERLGKILGCK